MPRQKTILRLDPNRCDRCGRCEGVCEPGALKIGPSYIYVDWRACDQCGKCIEVCDRGAIVRREEGGRRPKAVAKPKVRSKADRDESEPKVRKKTGKVARTSEVPTWTILEAFALLAVLFVVFMLKDAVLTSEWASAMRPATLVWLRVAALGVFYAIQIAALILLARFRGVELLGAMRMGRIGTSWNSKAISAACVVGLLLLTRTGAWVYGVTAQGLGWDPPVRWNLSLTDIFGPDSVGLALAIVMVVLVGPVIEEMIFRGVLLPAFDARMGRWIALGISSALFAGYHFNAWLLIPTFVLGFATGWLALQRESLWPAIALHSLYNVVPVAMAFYVVS